MGIQETAEAESWGNIPARVVTVLLEPDTYTSLQLRMFFGLCRPRAGETLNVLQTVDHGVVAQLLAAGEPRGEWGEIQPIHPHRRFSMEHAAKALRSAMDLVEQR